MINFKLGKPVFLDSQIVEAAEKTGIPADELRELARFSKSVMVNDTETHKKGEIVPLYTDNKKGEEPNSVYGPDAVILVCRQHGFEPVPITDVHIPNSVYFECNSDRTWLSISVFAAELSRQSERIGRFIALEVPDFILCNEWRILQELAQCLETNEEPGPERWEDGMIMRALCDVGYSLVSGWSPEKKKEFMGGYDADEEEKENG